MCVIIDVYVARISFLFQLALCRIIHYLVVLKFNNIPRFYGYIRLRCHRRVLPRIFQNIVGDLSLSCLCIRVRESLFQLGSQYSPSRLGNLQLRLEEQTCVVG